MTSQADMIVERRQIRRRLAMWRIGAIVAILVAVVAMLPRFDREPTDHIARVSVDGIILGDPKRAAAIRAIAEDDSAKALIVHVNSPGGAVVPAEDLYYAIREVAAAKPVVAVMSEYAASGGYITAIAADRIYARANTLTGSIGVYMDAPNIAGLLETLGVEVNRVRSAPLKGEPSISSPPSPEAMKVQQELITDTYTWFKDLVGERRGLSGFDLDRVADGRAFTGRQAVDLSLIDEIGDEAAARAWLIETHEISEDLDVRNTKWRDSELPWLLEDLERGAASIAQIEQLIGVVPRLYAMIR